MRILVTGNLGYIGPVLGKYIKTNNILDELIGIDLGFFSADRTTRTRGGDTYYNKQIYKDVRDISIEDLADCDAIVALAAVSNDPMGKAFENVTQEINHKANIRLAHLAQRAGIKKFILASSCSVYGAGGILPKTETDKVNPLTAYAKSKINCEDELKALASKEFQVICLRFATAYGASDRTRLDLVSNDFVWTHLATGRIKILSDGTPLRPLIDVHDMSRAITWAIRFEADENHLVLNCGFNESNYSVVEIAEIIASNDRNTIDIDQYAAPDKRSYKVDFTKFANMSGIVKPSKSLSTSVVEMRNQFKSLIASSVCSNIEMNRYKRLNRLNKLMESGDLNSNLTWKK